jgi:hypothetical protein
MILARSQDIRGIPSPSRGRSARGIGRGLVDRFYSGVTRYTTSSFLRAKLGEALKQRGMAPHIHESADEATAHLRSLEKEVKPK